MSYGDGSISEIKKPDGKSYNPKRWRVCLSYRVEETLDDGTVKTRRNKDAQDAGRHPHPHDRCHDRVTSCRVEGRQEKELSEIGVKQTGKTPVCCSDMGSWYRIDTFDNCWRAWRMAQGARFRRPQVPRAEAHAGHAAAR